MDLQEHRAMAGQGNIGPMEDEGSVAAGTNGKSRGSRSLSHFHRLCFYPLFLVVDYDETIRAK